MKLKKIAVLTSCTTLALAVSSCSTSKFDADTAKVQETNTPAQTTDTNAQAATESTNKTTAVKAASTTEATKVEKPKTATQTTDTNTQADTESTNKTTTVKAVSTTEPTKVERPKVTMNANASYTFGYQVGNGISKQGFDLNDDQTIAGFQDAMAGKDARLSQSKIDRNMDSLKDKMMKKQIDIARDNKTKSAEFMAEVAKMDNAIKVNNQAYYQVVTQGKGQKPNADSTVTIAYKGTTPVTAYDADKSKLNDVKEAKLIGSSFDSSNNATFPLNNLIQCWKDAIPEIPVGSTVVLYCAPEAAYGTRAPASIGPNQVLAFEITLKGFK